MKTAIEAVRGLVRPVITLGVVIAFCISCFIESIPEKQFAALQALALMVVGFYFRDRAVDKATDKLTNGLNENHNNQCNKKKKKNGNSRKSRTV